MKKVLTIPSLLFNSFLVVIFAACGVNAHKKVEICSDIGSEMYLPKDNSAKSPIEDNSHPIFVPKNSQFNNDSHPMVISPCSKLEE